MQRNVFGVEHQIAKADDAAAMKLAHLAGEHSKGAVKGCTRCGPGSQRGRMSMRAWESQSASHTKKETIQTMGGGSG